MDPRSSFLDWLLLTAETAACNCETVAAGQHDPNHLAAPADPEARAERPRKGRLPKLIPCSPALHAITD